MRIREDVFKHLTLCLAYGRKKINGSIKIGHCCSGKKVGLKLGRLVLNPSTPIFSLR